jgi:thiamine kinase-like enzyme
MNIAEQIIPYIAANAGSALGIADFSGATIKQLHGGDYNYNYHVHVAGRDVVVRLCIEPQSGSEAQIEHEYATLEFLAAHGVTPKPYFLDNSRKHFPYGLLIEDFIPGGHVQFSVPAVRRVASAMATLHTINIDSAPLERRNNPLQEQLDSVIAYLGSYKQRQKPNHELLSVSDKIIQRVKKDIPKLAGLYAPRSIIHTDPNPANIIDTGERAYFIDWEQGRIDDPSYDVAAFFSDALNLWASPRVLTAEEKQSFITTYTEKTGDTTIKDRIPARLMLYTVTAVIWGAMRMADVDEGKIDPNLGAQNYARYQKLASADELKKMLTL